MLTLLKLLKDGRFHSGEALGAALGISRSAVWKQLQHLEAELNLPIHKVRGRGYQLASPLVFLNAEDIVLHAALAWFWTLVLRLPQILSLRPLQGCALYASVTQSLHDRQPNNETQPLQLPQTTFNTQHNTVINILRKRTNPLTTSSSPTCCLLLRKHYKRCRTVRINKAQGLSIRRVNGIEGVVLGVDHQGALRLSVDGAEKIYSGGELSLRLRDDS